MAQDPLDPTAKRDLLGALHSSFHELKGALPAPDAISPARDDWGVFEVVAHLSGWHSFSARRLRQIASNEPPMTPGDEDSMNVRFVRERSNLTADELLRQLQDSFNDLVSAVETVAESEFWRGKDGEEDSLAYFIANANGPEHYAEHLPDLREWLKTN